MEFSSQTEADKPFNQLISHKKIINAAYRAQQIINNQTSTHERFIDKLDNFKNTTVTIIQSKQ